MATKVQVDAVDRKIDKVERSLIHRMGKLRIDLAGRIAKVSTATATSDQFGKLEERVDRLEKVHSN